MKKLLISISLMAMCSFAAFAVEFSLGGYVGSVVEQNTPKNYGTTFRGLPQFGLAFNADFQNFGINTSIGIDFWANRWKNGKASAINENILVTPYVPFRYKKFMFTIGPTLGFKLNQYKDINTDTDNKTSMHWLYVTLGGEFETRYAITDHFKAFLNLGLFTNTGSVQTKHEETGKSHELTKFRWLFDDVYFSPKIGLLYTF